MCFIRFKSHLKGIEIFVVFTGGGKISLFCFVLRFLFMRLQKFHANPNC